MSFDGRGALSQVILTGSNTMRPSYWTWRGTEIWEIKAGRGGDGTGAGAGGWASLAARDEKLLFSWPA